MFLNRQKNGAFGNIHPEMENSEIFTQSRIDIKDVRVMLYCIMDLHSEILMKDYILPNRDYQEKFSASYKKVYKLFHKKDFK